MGHILTLDLNNFSDCPIDPHSFQVNKFLSEKDIQTLHADQRINDSCMNAILSLLRVQSKILITSTYFMTKVFSLLEDTSGEIRWSESNLSTSFRFDSLTHHSKILLPLLHECHYTLFEIDLIQKTINYYDPLEGDPAFTEIEKLIDYWCQRVQKLLPDLKFTYARIHCPKQKIANDCGVVMILNIISILSDKEPIYDYDSVKIRSQLEISLIQGNLDFDLIKTMIHLDVH